MDFVCFRLSLKKGKQENIEDQQKHGMNCFTCQSLQSNKRRMKQDEKYVKNELSFYCTNNPELKRLREVDVGEV